MISSPCSIRWRPSPRPDPTFRRLLRAATVKGGRRPSRSDLPLTGASTAADFLDRRRHGGDLGLPESLGPCWANGRRYRGKLAIRRNVAPQTCIRSIREDRDHDAIMRISGEAPRRRAHSKPRLKDHSPTSGCHHLGPSSAARYQQEGDLQEPSSACPQTICQTAGRRSKPVGASPVVTSRQSAIRSLRASATIMVFRVPLRA